MAESAGKMLVSRLEDAMNRRALDELDAIVAPDFVRLCGATPDLDIHDLDGFKAFHYAAAFPDDVQTFTHVAVDGDLIGVFATYEGTHLGPLWPVPPRADRSGSTSPACSRCATASWPSSG